ncbi:MAG: 2-oxoacid:ferredoxin oxidoreductase subunit beta [Candidatus Cloacimonetes bacterium]|nr:2-oxoacid:ferredoxin oxidoreductase subunit beta [Candidatus Cloacimonadota bacterium]
MSEAKEFLNRLNLAEKDYSGAPSTMCQGCGHDAISASIRKAFYDSSIDPKQVIKLSGIGCSSKTPAYFLGKAFGINTVHGRMSAVATGAIVANHTLLPIGVSGDGDTSAIGLGNFCHMIRRNLNFTYIIENNGVYGLTKGQFSATADKGTALKKGKINQNEAIDLCELAITMGATFVARSFSGDRKQLAPLIQAALAHKGLAILDVLSPCVTFNNHEGSKKSLKNIRAHLDPIHDIDFMPGAELIEVDYKKGSETEVVLYDGSIVTLKKLHENYDPMNKMGAILELNQAKTDGKFLTGLIYFEPNRPTFTEQLDIRGTALAYLPEDKLRPSIKHLDAINKKLSM